MRAPGAGLSMRCCGGSTVYRITRVRRVVSPPSFLPPFALSPSSLFVFPPRSLPLCLSLSPWRSISPACILPKYLDCCRCIVRNGRPNDAPGQSRGSHPPVPRKSKAKADYSAIIARAAGAACSLSSRRERKIFRSGLFHTARLNPKNLRYRLGIFIFPLKLDAILKLLFLS